MGGEEKSRYAKKIECVELSDFSFSLKMFWELSLYVIRDTQRSGNVWLGLISLKSRKLFLKLGSRCVLGGLIHVSGLFMLPFPLDVL